MSDVKNTDMYSAIKEILAQKSEVDRLIEMESFMESIKIRARGVKLTFPM